MDPRAFLTQLYRAAVARALPSEQMARYLPSPPKGRTVVIGAGKAADSMVAALESLWPADAAISGLVVTRYGHTAPRPAGHRARIEVVEAAHPVPDAAGVAAAQRMMALVQNLSADDLVIALISGGGSSLITWPCEGLDLAQMQAIQRALLESGADIAQMNIVRKHLSRTHGGRLGAACAPAPVVTLAISDVPGDELGVIASGPTVADPSTCADALAIVDRLGIDLPPSVRAALQSGVLESPKPDAAIWRHHRSAIIATPRASLEAAAAKANELGVRAYVLSDAIEGESREVGKVHAALALAASRGYGAFEAPCVLLSGGETTVSVQPPKPGAAKGRGGRAGEFCLGLAQGLNGAPGIHALAADTDGIDGVEDNAGAFVDPQTLERARSASVSLSDAIERHDAYGFFAAIGDLFVTGPTHTNVNDFRAVWIDVLERGASSEQVGREVLPSPLRILGC